ncbi:aminotransferase class I/II-fold pyridoxal phosphate-dependent enzyme [Arenibacter sp. F20364]|uniref:aminotransferase class I/II-fold pyridoxal phosphate-dependent enzyme n=1 Tax=Arenibacter sp. F20364 TaxID=2926415 RepID=UPI001FF6CB2D|nr:aminotransferase class I/II-fold pyridoxal phosphate-dependent enzyme [Arenibacter sp. F20364]MCK0191906.1 bifunctional aminotransferase class I/II-fold pyridoxal phosphate-dependent enzyme/GNAT family N-acetyltransferase [Arenibacter sp. F20364]
MAKIKPNNFLDTVDSVFNDAKKQGILHLYAEGDQFTGRHIRIGDKNLFHFGTTGYLGLEQDPRLKKAAVDAINRYGTQFPLSKTYISHPLYKTLEDKVTEMYSSPVIITKNSTLGHIGVIPSAVDDQDAIILDHQVHWSVQSAAKLLKARSIPIDMIRHNNLEMLEDKIRKLASKHKRIWYMADGVYSMFGDVSPVMELMKLCNKYQQLHLYFDDVHGMSWIGKNGTGYVLDILKELPEQVLLFGTLSKTFGASGSVFTCANAKMYSKIKNFGGPLTFSAQLEPASVAAAIASADIHLSSEIYSLQADLVDRITYFNMLLSESELPLVEHNNSPVFYIGTGMPVTGYNFVNRMMKEGYFVNLGLFPAVPVKNTGVRITISRHNQKEEIKGLVEAMQYHYPRALEATNTTDKTVRSAFKLAVIEKGKIDTKHKIELNVHYANSIFKIPKNEWDGLLGEYGIFDWEGLRFLEAVFSKNKKKEENWKFHYYIVRDLLDKPILATFFTYSLWKDDMLAPESVSQKVEEIRKHHPYHMTSHVLGMGSLFTEGEHLYLDTSHPLWHEALHRLLDELEKLDRKFNAKMLVFRDFTKDEKLHEFFHNHGFIKVSMPDSSRISNLKWKDNTTYISNLSKRSRSHFRKDIEPYIERFKVVVTDKIEPSQHNNLFNLMDNVRQNNLGLNTFPFPKKIFKIMSDHPGWEFIILSLKAAFAKDGRELVVGVMFCYKNVDNAYVPAFIGMDYEYAKVHQVYRQLLYQTIKRAGETGFDKIPFGMTSAFEKRKLGAMAISQIAYVQSKDNYNLELVGMLENSG